MNCYPRRTARFGGARGEELAIPDHYLISRNGEQTPFTIVRSDRRTLAIVVHADGSVVARAPRRVREAHVVAFVNARSEWVERKRREAAARVPASAYVAGEVHRYLGRPYVLMVETGDQGGVERDGETLTVTLRGEVSQDRVRQALERWYLAQAQRHLPDRLALCWPAFASDGERVPPLRIRTLRSRWGSLSSSGAMTLNAHLMRLPVVLIDSVIFHELCHLRVRGHGTAFYRELERYVPEWKAIRRQLRDA